MRSAKYFRKKLSIILAYVKMQIRSQKYSISDKGTADEATTTLLKSLRNKKIFLFGTAGFGGSEEYYQKVLHNVRENIDPSNQIVGEYMCQGKMPMAMRERYVKMKEDPNHKPNLDMLIENFDRALSHPDKADLEKLQKSVLR